MNTFKTNLLASVSCAGQSSLDDESRLSMTVGRHHGKGLKQAEQQWKKTFAAQCIDINQMQDNALDHPYWY